MPQKPIIAVLGSRKSGKTTTVEILVQGLAEKGYRIATAKHIPETDFTIDTEGKDTWRHARAGARIIIGVAPKETAVIRKVEATHYNIKKFIEEYQDEADVTILEGFSRLIGRDPRVPKIVSIKTIDEIPRASNRFKPIIAFVGPMTSEAIPPKISYVDRVRAPEKLIDLVDKRLANLVKRREIRQKKLKIQINGSHLPLNPFIQKIIGNSLLAMISTLDNTDIEGTERISVTIERSAKT